MNSDAAVLDRPADLSGVKVLDEDEVCHILEGENEATVCGAPFDCSTTGKIWEGESTCPHCSRLVCPECFQRARGLS